MHIQLTGEWKDKHNKHRQVIMRTWKGLFLFSTVSPFFNEHKWKN